MRLRFSVSVRVHSTLALKESTPHSASGRSGPMPRCRRRLTWSETRCRSRGLTHLAGSPWSAARNLPTLAGFARCSRSRRRAPSV